MQRRRTKTLQLCARGVVALFFEHAKREIELARRRAVERMEADLLWLNGAGAAYKPLAEQYPGLIKQVRELRQGAFAPFFQQPLVQAILVPLGGAGGVQLLDYLLLARSP